MEIWEEHELVFHYTTEAGLGGILGTQAIHATHYKYLNDRQEIRQLLPRLREHITPHIQKSITRIVQHDRRGSDLVKQHGGLGALAAHEAAAAIDALYKATFRMRSVTNFFEPFIASFCAHDGDYEKCNGLLSQWRAYGSNVGYAIAFNTKLLCEVFKNEADNFAYNSVHVSDVVYDGDVEKFQAEFADLLDQLAKIMPKIFEREESDLNALFGPFMSAATRFKHRGFREEKEIRCVFPPISEEWLKRLERDQPEDFKEKLVGKPAKKIQYRAGMVPYIILGEGNPVKLPIKYIIVGPDANKDSRRDKLEKYLELSGLSIEVKVSDTPLV